MKFSKNLMTGLIGVAMLAMPIAAAAQNNHDSGKNNSRQASQSESRPNESRSNASAHSAPAVHNEAHEQHSARIETRNAAPANMNRNEGREEHSARVETRTAAPAVAIHNEARDNGHGYKGAPAVATRDSRVYRNDGRDWNHDGRDYRGYGRDYAHDYYDHDRDYAANGWVMPRGYGGGACAWAQHLRNVYRHDEYTGHPAAAADLLYQLHRAERSCGVPYGYNSWRY
jgi:hypothetical protein